MAGDQGALRPLARGVTLIRKLWTEERVTSRASTTGPRTPRSTIGPTKPVPIYVAAAGPQVAKYAGRVGDGFICTSGKAPELYTETLLPNVDGGPGRRASDRSAASTA